MSNSDLYLTWENNSQREEVYKATADNVDAYTGIQKSSGHSYGPRTTYIDIEPNRSIRPSFGRDDYNAFRPGEAVPTKQKMLIAQCMNAYSHVGIIRNVIDLMSDFSAQGIALVHPNSFIAASFIINVELASSLFSFEKLLPCNILLFNVSKKS